MNFNNHVHLGQGLKHAQPVIGICLLALALISNVSAEQSGKELMENRCTMCHELPDPDKLSKEAWVLQLESMSDYAGLTAGEKEKVLDYVASHEKKAVTIVSMAEEQKTFEQKCALCHTTSRVFLMPLNPESRRHIVLRMQERAPEIISMEDVHGILEYLNHGAPGAVKPEARKQTGNGPAEIFRERCTACHTAERVYLKLQQSEQQDDAVVWGHIVNRMREKSPEWITKDEAKLILEYLGSIKAEEANPAGK